MKPTQISVPKGGLNQIPPSCKISGDVRLTPFYKLQDVKDALQNYVKDINDVCHYTSLAFFSFFVFLTFYILK